jgi:predicted esterase
MISELHQALANWPGAEDDLGPSRLCLMGHSVGAWFLCELMKKLPEQIDGGYMLFPTVGWIADSWNGRTLWVRPPLHSVHPCH